MCVLTSTCSLCVVGSIAKAKVAGGRRALLLAIVSHLCTKIENLPLPHMIRSLIITINYLSVHHSWIELQSIFFRGRESLSPTIKLLPSRIHTYYLRYLISYVMLVWSIVHVKSPILLQIVIIVNSVELLSSQRYAWKRPKIDWCFWESSYRWGS